MLVGQKSFLYSFKNSYSLAPCEEFSTSTENLMLLSQFQATNSLSAIFRRIPVLLYGFWDYFFDPG